jgi:hypothetical protein
MSYDSKLKQKALQQVKDGVSLRQVSKDLNIPLSTISYWCNGKIKSFYVKTQKKSDDDEIIKTIKNNLALTERELEKKLNYGKNSLRPRLIKLTKTNMLNYVVIPGGRGSILRGYIDRKIYFIDKDDLKKWLSKRIPKGLPSGIKHMITQRLHDSGIDFQFEHKKKKAIVVDETVYRKLERKAKRKGISVTELIKKM